mgnify:CR=1 FL=1
MKKHIIREVPPESYDNSYYFDGKFYQVSNIDVAIAIWLGAYKEFCVVDLDDSGNEVDTCYGFCVADCQVKTEEDYKKLVCEWEGIKEEETSLEMIDEQKHYTKYIYKEVA